MSTVVPFVRSYWGLIRRLDDGRTALELTAVEPTAEQVADAAGVLLMTGMMAGDCPSVTIDMVGALPTMPRFDLFSGVSDAKGIATIAFTPAFAATPKALASAVPSALAGSVKAEIVAGSLTAAGCKVKVTTAALATGAITVLAGATVTVLTIGL